jgi:cation:H+ antiporter
LNNPPPFLRFAALALAGAGALQAGSPWNILWAGPAILLASLMIAWGAEATQFFLAQGIALALLALLQTLPEFAVEAILAWHRDVPDLFANLTGALMLLTGIGWPMIYFSAATAHRREHQQPMRVIELEDEHAVQVAALFAALVWQFVVWWKGELNLLDSAVLLAIYVGYLWVMSRLPPEEREAIGEIGRAPRAIVLAPRPLRVFAILALFVIGGGAVFLVVDPFLAGLFGLSTLIGISRYQFIQWIAPLVSESPEGISAFYWARDYRRASIALMNMVSSNINQWTLLAGLLPVVLSLSAGRATPIPLDAMQSRDLLLTLAQSLLGAILLLDMRLRWYEAAALLVLFLVSFADIRGGIRIYVMWIYFAWSGVEIFRLIFRNRGNARPNALGRLRSVLTGSN